MFVGHEITGGVTSTTVTLNLHVLTRLPLSVAVHVTILEPFTPENVDPLTGEHDTLLMPELEDAEGVHVAVEARFVELPVTNRLEGH